MRSVTLAPRALIGYSKRMTFLRCLLLLAVACGSKPAPAPVVEAAVATTAPPPKPVAIAFVLEGHEMWVGNDTLDVPEHERYPGALRPLVDAFAKVPLARAPAGSRAMVITYGETATVRHPMAPIGTLTAAAFGEQKDYAGVVERDLVGGVTLALDELAKAGDMRRVLVVIGDGTDSNPDHAKDALGALAQRAEAEQVQRVSLIYKGVLSSPANPLVAFDPAAMTVTSMDGAASALEAMLDGFAPPPPAASGTGLALALLVSGQEIWMGNDDITPAGDPSRYSGALKALRAALDATPMTGFPPGSTAMVLRYDTKLAAQRAAGPIEKLDAKALGDQRTYYGAIGSELVSGVRGALSQLARTSGGRRVLIVLGDGSDTNNEAAKAQLRALREKAAERHIEIHAIVWKAALSGEDSVIQELVPDATTAPTTTDLTAQLSALLGSLR